MAQLNGAEGKLPGTNVDVEWVVQRVAGDVDRLLHCSNNVIGAGKPVHCARNDAPLAGR